MKNQFQSPNITYTQPLAFIVRQHFTALNMKTKYFSTEKLNILIFLTLFFSSCDPALDEKIVINNQSSKSLIIIIEKKGNFKDTTEYYYQYDYENPRRFLGDSLLVVECSVNSGSKLTLLDHGPLGTISIQSKEEGMFYLNEITDSIYLVNHYLIKDILNKDNWDLYIDSYKNGGGISEFSFTINDEDIEEITTNANKRCIACW
jgi:hypothetical protein